MKIKILVPFALIATIFIAITGCQKGDLLSNPNAATQSVIPVSLVLNHLTANLIRSEELPFGDVNKSNQFQVSNYSKYWGNNEYSWTYSGHSYDILKYAIQLENQAKAQVGNTNNKYFAVSKFFRAYSFIWLSQRVGDIPMNQAGNSNYTNPVFDTQKDVYKNALALLDTANTIIASATTASTQGVVFDAGDIFGFTNLQWQKLINTYKLRLLISLSKRADDNADLNIKSQFAAIVTNPTKYPVMTGNSDNMVYKFNSTNLYPIFSTGSGSYNNFMNVGKTVLDITTTAKDPRTYLFATPAPGQITGGKTIADFTAYIGTDPKLALTALQTASDAGNSSYFNGIRYFGNNSAGTIAEPFIFIGYPEMCFNIAEGINRSWAPSLGATDAKTWYDNGIAASFKNFGLSTTANSTVSISNVAGASVGSVTTDNATFLANVTYNTANSATALTQILQQKYVAFFMNSGWEAFYNYRRTGVPSFSSGGAGTGTPSGAIPTRWLYPLDEINFNNDNYKTSVGSQYAGTDDVNGKMWLIK
jgi:Starch-binding associating with outer membrane